VSDCEELVGILTGDDGVEMVGRKGRKNRDDGHL